MTSDTWDEFAKEWDSEPDVQMYSNLAFGSWQRRVLPLISDISKTRVLDFGCGTGQLTEKLSPLCEYVVAVDTSRRMIEILNSKIVETGINNVTSLVSTIDPKSIAENRHTLGQFGLVVASSVCSFLADFEVTLRHIAATMNSGGVFVHWDWMDDMPFDKVRSAFSGAGMKCLRVEREFTIGDRNESMAVVMGIGKLVH
jgi:SAM-dependent methyltransferase